MNRCFDGLVGINGLCEGKEYQLLLDDIGISLHSASKTADSKFANGAELVERKIKQAWREVLKDLSFSGFKFKQIACEKDFFGDGKTKIKTAGSAIIKIKKKDNKRITSLCFAQFAFSGEGSYTLTISDDKGTTYTYSGNENILFIREKFFGSEITINVSYGKAYSRNLHSSCCECNNTCNLEIQAKETHGISFVIQEICDVDAYFCRYAEMIADAVLYKAGALILKEIMDTDRINDFHIVKQEDLWVRMAFFDSSFNMFKYEDKTAVKDDIKVAKGQYQIEIERLKKLIPIPKDRICIDCDSAFYSVALP